MGYVLIRQLACIANDEVVRTSAKDRDYDVVSRRQQNGSRRREGATSLYQRRSQVNPSRIMSLWERQQLTRAGGPGDGAAGRGRGRPRVREGSTPTWKSDKRRPLGLDCGRLAVPRRQPGQ